MNVSVVFFVLWALFSYAYGSPILSTTGQVQCGCATQATGLVYVINSTSNAVYVVETSTNRAAVLDGNTGEAAYYDLKKKTGIYVASNAWLAANSNIQTYLLGVTSLETLLKSNTYKTVKISTFDDSLYAFYSSIMGDLSDEIRSTAQESFLQSGFAYLLALTDSFSTSLSDTTLLQLIDSKPTTLGGDIVWLSHVFNGINSFFGKTQFGLEDFVGLGVSLDLSEIFSASNGINALISILDSIKVTIDLGIALGTGLNDFETIINVISLLGGEGKTNVDGVFTVLSKTIKYALGNTNLDDLNEGLINFGANLNSLSTSIDISTPINNLITSLSTSPWTTAISDEVSGLINILNIINSDSFIISEINISTVLEYLSKPALSVSEADIMINVLDIIEADIYTSVPSLLLTYVKLFNHTLTTIPNNYNCSNSLTGLSRRRRDLIGDLLGGVGGLVNDTLSGVGDIVSDVGDLVGGLLGGTTSVLVNLLGVDISLNAELNSGTNAIDHGLCYESNRLLSLRLLVNHCKSQPIFKIIKYWLGLFYGVAVDLSVCLSISV